MLVLCWCCGVGVGVVIVVVVCVVVSNAGGKSLPGLYSCGYV